MSYQKCPVCEGSGSFMDFTQSLESFTINGECPTCKGTRIIDSITGLPPKKEEKFKLRLVTTGHLGITKEELKNMHIVEYEQKTDKSQTT